MSRFRQEAGAVGTTQPAPRFRALLSTEKRGLRTLRIRMRTRRVERERARRRARYPNEWNGERGSGVVGGGDDRANDDVRWWGKDSVRTRHVFETLKQSLISWTNPRHPRECVCTCKGRRGDGQWCSLYSARRKILVRYNVYTETRPRRRPRPYLPSSTCSCELFFVFITIPLWQRSIRYRGVDGICKYWLLCLLTSIGKLFEKKRKSYVDGILLNSGQFFFLEL